MVHQKLPSFTFSRYNWKRTFLTVGKHIVTKQLMKLHYRLYKQRAIIHVQMVGRKKIFPLSSALHDTNVKFKTKLFYNE